MDNTIYEKYTSVAVFASEREEKEFTAWGDFYFRKRIASHLPADREAAILEIGCGYGRYLMAMAKLGYRNVYGIDISEEQIAYATQTLGLTNVAQADAMTFMSERTQHYQVVMLLDVVEHLELSYAITLLRKVYETLPSGGKLIIQVPNALAPLSPNYYGDVTHVGLYSPRTMAQLLATSNFTQYRHYSLPPIPHGLKSTIRKALWSGLLHPLIKGYLLVANGDSMGDIYTSNFLTVATKP